MPLTPKQERIVDMATMLFVVKGFNAASIRDIAKACGITTSTIFSHFEGKDALYRATIKKYILSKGNFADKVGDCSKMTLKEFIAHYIDTLVSEKDHLFDEYKKFLDKLDEGTSVRFAYTQYRKYILEAGCNYEDVADFLVNERNQEINFITKVVQNAIDNKEIRANIEAKTVAETMVFTIKGILHSLCYEGYISKETILTRLDNIYKTLL